MHSGVPCCCPLDLVAFVRAVDNLAPRLNEAADEDYVMGLESFKGSLQTNFAGLDC